MLSTTVTTGLIANEYGISIGNVGAFSRFSNLFDEYRIVSCRIELIPMGIYTGDTAFFFAERTLGTPTPTEANQRHCRRLKNNIQASRNPTMRWSNKDFTDASWSSTGTTVTPVYFYTYTDGANFGAPITVNQLWNNTMTLVMQFRGLKSS